MGDASQFGIPALGSIKSVHFVRPADSKELRDVFKLAFGPSRRTNRGHRL